MKTGLHRKDETEMKPCVWLARELHGENDNAPCTIPLDLGNPPLPKSVTNYYAFEWPLPRADR